MREPGGSEAEDAVNVGHLVKGFGVGVAEKPGLVRDGEVADGHGISYDGAGRGLRDGVGDGFAACAKSGCDIVAGLGGEGCGGGGVEFFGDEAVCAGC